MPHPALLAGNVALITGGASGIGLAAALWMARRGVRVCIADIEGERLSEAEARLVKVAPKGVESVMAHVVDVSNVGGTQHLHDAVMGRFGTVDILMNNAGIQPGSGIFGPSDNWNRVLAVNLWGVIHGSQIFVPKMIAKGSPGLVINTGSKQGITTPPGDPAYNISKAGVKVFTEALAHELRNTPDCKIDVHLLIPGFVFTGLTAKGRSEKPAGAWTAEQTVDFMFEGIEAKDFYIICPDNDVPRSLDEMRILWAARDIVENRPPLSRWHPDYAEPFTNFIKSRHHIDH